MNHPFGDDEDDFQIGELISRHVWVCICSGAVFTQLMCTQPIFPLYLGHGEGAGPVQGRPGPAHLGAQGGRGHPGHHQVHRRGGVRSGAMSTSVGLASIQIAVEWSIIYI